MDGPEANRNNVIDYETRSGPALHGAPVSEDARRAQTARLVDQTSDADAHGGATGEGVGTLEAESGEDKDGQARTYEADVHPDASGRGAGEDAETPPRRSAGGRSSARSSKE